MEKLGQNIKFSILSEMTEDLDFFYLKRDTISELGRGATTKAPSPILEHLRSGDYGFCLKV